MFPRLPGWEARFDAFLEARQRTPFAWGANDCASFGIASVEILTGADIWPVTWSTATEALHVIAAAGGLEAAISTRLGPPSGNWRRCRRGDIALAEMNARPAVMVCTGQTLCGPGPLGLDHRPLDRALEVWRIG